MKRSAAALVVATVVLFAAAVLIPLAVAIAYGPPLVAPAAVLGVVAAVLVLRFGCEWVLARMNRANER